MKGKTHDLNHDLTFSAHTINYVCHSIRSMFIVLGIYNFGARAEMCKKISLVKKIYSEIIWPLSCSPDPTNYNSKLSRIFWSYKLILIVKKIWAFKKVVKFQDLKFRNWVLDPLSKILKIFKVRILDFNLINLIWFSFFRATWKIKAPVRSLLIRSLKVFWVRQWKAIHLSKVTMMDWCSSFQKSSLLLELRVQFLLLKWFR